MRYERFDCKKCAGTGFIRTARECFYCEGEGQIWREIWETSDRIAHMAKIGAKYGPKNGGRYNKGSRDYYTARKAAATDQKERT